mgnify:CR=1 FL=1
MTAVQKTNNAFSTKAKKELEVGKEISQGGLVYRKLADGTGTWRYDFMEAGERHKGVIGAERSGVTLSEARRHLGALRAKATIDRMSGKIGRSTYVSRKFADVAQDFLDWSSEHHQDMRHNKGRMKAHLLPRFGHMKLGDITTSHIEAMRTDLYQTGLKRGTVERIVSLLSGVFEHARKSDRNLRNPTRDLTRIKSQSKESRVFTEGETEAMLETGCVMYNAPTRGANKGKKVVDERRTAEAKAMIGLGLYAGLRASEVLGLSWQDINLERGIILVQRTAQDGVLRESTKNYETRKVPFRDTLRSLLESLKDKQASSNRAGNLLFSEDGTKPYFQVQGIFRRVKAQSGIEIIGGFHSFRHTFATRASNKGVPMTHLQMMLGHSDLKVTMGYVHTGEEDIMRTAELMD